MRRSEIQTEEERKYEQNGVAGDPAAARAG